jgi:hypothetical protein
MEEIRHFLASVYDYRINDVTRRIDFGRKGHITAQDIKKFLK